MATTKKSTVKKTTAKKTTKTSTAKAKSIRDNKTYGVQCAYILDCIKDAYLDNETKKRPTDKDLINYAIDRFDREYNHPYNKKAIPNIQARIGEWLQGLALPVDFSWDDIVKIGKKWGYCKTKKEESQFIDRWFNVLAFRMIQTWEYYNKPQSIHQKLG